MLAPEVTLDLVCGKNTRPGFCALCSRETLQKLALWLLSELGTPAPQDLVVWIKRCGGVDQRTALNILTSMQMELRPLANFWLLLLFPKQYFDLMPGSNPDSGGVSGENGKQVEITARFLARVYEKTRQSWLGMVREAPKKDLQLDLGRDPFPEISQEKWMDYCSQASKAYPNKNPIEAESLLRFPLYMALVTELELLLPAPKGILKFGWEIDPDTPHKKVKKRALSIQIEPECWSQYFALGFAMDVATPPGRVQYDVDVPCRFCHGNCRQCDGMLKRGKKGKLLKYCCKACGDRERQKTKWWSDPVDSRTKEKAKRKERWKLRANLKPWSFLMDETHRLPERYGEPHRKPGRPKGSKNRRMDQNAQSFSR